MLLPMVYLNIIGCLLVAFGLWPMVTYAQTAESNSCRENPRGTYNPSFAFEEPPCDVTKGLIPPGLFSHPQPAQVAPVGFDKYSNKVFVNGYVFDADDYQAAVESQKALDWPLVQMPSNYRPLSPEEYKRFISNSAYRIKHPILAYGKRILSRIENHFRREHKEFQRYKKYVEAEIAKCSAIADRKFAGDIDAQMEYFDDCVQPLYIK